MWVVINTPVHRGGPSCFLMNSGDESDENEAHKQGLHLTLSSCPPARELIMTGKIFVNSSELWWGSGNSAIFFLYRYTELSTLFPPAFTDYFVLMFVALFVTVRRAHFLISPCWKETHRNFNALRNAGGEWQKKIF